MKPDHELYPDPCYCIRMRRAANRITDYYGDMLLATGVTPNQFSLLATLSHMEGCGTGQLAKAVGLEKSTLVRTLQPVIKAGFIRDSAPQHTRKRQLSLTSLGKETLEKGIPLWKAAQQHIQAKLGKNHQEILTLLAALDHL